MKIILIMGLPGAGKTTLANELAKLIESKRLNADEIRRAANDWDFSEEGRKRQSKRMSDAALKLKNEGNNVIADFICPTPEARKLFPADYIAWVGFISFFPVSDIFCKRVSYLRGVALKIVPREVLKTLIFPVPHIYHNGILIHVEILLQVKV